MKHSHKAAALLAGVALAATALPAAAQDQVSFQLWTKEGTADGSLQFVQKLVDEYVAANPNVSITVTNKDVETLRTEFLNTTLGGQAPELLWTVSDHVGPFTVADAISSTDDLGIDVAPYLPNALQSVQLDGKTWGLPISFGNHLMLFTNKDLMPECPADTDAWIAAAKSATGNGNYGIVYHQGESFWLVPWLGGFGGSVFGEDGITATLNTPQMVDTLTFLKDLKWTQGVMPAEADYNVADGMFKNGAPGAAPAADASLAPSQTPAPTGVAASVINGDWTVGAYYDLFGDKLNICPIPQVTGHDWPTPYVAGTYFMFSKALANDPAKQAAVLDFAKWVTDKTQQLDMVSTLKRLPGTNDAFNDPSVANDPILGASAAAAVHGAGTPGQLEMRCVWDATRTGIQKIYTDQNADPAAVAQQMQADYDSDARCMA